MLAMNKPVVVTVPVRPTKLLDRVLALCTYPTTVVICASSDDFVRQAVDDQDNKDDQDKNEDEDEARADRRDSPAPQPQYRAISLLQVAVARHIRVVFLPTVAHLRGFLAALDIQTSRVAAPPQVPPHGAGDTALVVYGFLRLHRDTSEWSAQGLAASAAVLAEAGWRTRLQVVLMEGDSGDGSDGGHEGTVPVLSAVPRKQMQRAGYALRTARVRTVLVRWFVFREQWEEGLDDEEGGQEETPSQKSQGTGRGEKVPNQPPKAKTYVKDSEDSEDSDDGDDDVDDVDSSPPINS